MAYKTQPLATWPWNQWSEGKKYLLYMPLGVLIGYELLFVGDGSSLLSNTFLHIILISALRCAIYEAWHVVSRSNFWFKTRRIQSKQVDFDQVDRELDWDNYVILQALVAAICAQLWAPQFARSLPIFDVNGVLLLVLLHAGPAELVYYCVHRAFHRNTYLYGEYHFLHHLSTRPEPSTAGTATFLEHLLLTAVMAIPLVGITAGRVASMSLFYAYILAFDFVRFMIHSNVEVTSFLPFKAVPLFKYLAITPSYHSLHHMHENGNYCLFVPLYDYLGGTLDPRAFKLHEDISRVGKEVVVPDSVFVPHGVDLTTILHLGPFGRAFSAYPRKGGHWFAQIWTPFVFIGTWIFWFWGKTFTIGGYSFLEVTHQNWAVPLVGFQYFLPNAHASINNILEKAILEADRIGVKVITLGALNKNEAMNEGALLFIKRLKNLNVRVCHGNTLTTAAILHKLPQDVTEVFLTGSTSKIGQAIALYLCRKNVRVLMLTASEERFAWVVSKAPKDCQRYLVRATEYQAAQNCQIWIVGKWANAAAQRLAPVGTQFYQFVMPTIPHVRRDCRYYDTAAIKLPEKLVRGLSTCEHTMPRYVVHACHAGGLLHALEGWRHHEVGSVDVEQLDVVWEAAMKYGFALPS